MSINPLPPQAYTKDTLAKAFQWLQGQPEEVKSLAKSSDLLVGLYLKAHRDGPQVLQGKSFQNFRQELKSLAEMVEDFVPSTGSQVYASAQPASSSAGQSTQSPPGLQGRPAVPNFDLTVPSSPSAAVHQPQAQLQSHSQSHSQVQSASPSSAQSVSTMASQVQSIAAESPSRAAPSAKIDVLEGLDARTLQHLELVQKQLNLSSPKEALRMLVTLGYERIKSLFP